MSRSKCLQQVVRLSLAAATLAAAIPAYAQENSSEKGATLGAVIVTAQKREESIQDVPIAVSAFSAADLTSRGLDGGPNMMEAVPNLNFSKSNFTSFNLQIRGIGSKLVGGSGDQGVGIHLNNAPMAVSRFFEAEFYDVERVEILRGPQGTLYGRNATGGVFNAITAKPSDKYEGNISLDIGNYNSRKIKGVANLPLSEVFQLRVAGSVIKRDGFLYDAVHDTKVDGRDLKAGRVTLAFKPSDSVSGYLMWDHFEENDDRQRTGKQLCAQDTGPTSVGGVSTTQMVSGGAQPMQPQWFLSQGCLPVSIYDTASFSAVNSNGSLGGLLANLVGIGSGNLYAGKTISRDLRSVESRALPVYRAKSDIAELNLEIKPTDHLKLTSLTSFNQDHLYSREDYNNAVPSRGFNPIPGLAPGGVFTDPQLGASNSLAVSDISFADNKTWTEELRLQSAFDGPVNFNVGAIYLDNNNPNTGYYVFFNTATVLAYATNPPVPGPTLLGRYVDPNYEPDETGHNYYYNKQGYELKSKAAFGELYWQMSDSFKWTLGLRYTDDTKDVTNYGIQMLVQTLGTVGGFPASSITKQNANWKTTTGRLGFDWKVSDNSLLYAFYSKGYKGGGFNPASFGNVKETFDPEYVNSIELGTKNTFANGSVQLNATLFHYDYKGYQISRIVNLTSVNENIDAKIDGAEIEFAWLPLKRTRIDSNIGYLKTKIDGGSSVDTMNRTQGDPTLTVVKGSSAGSNCAVTTSGLATLLTFMNNATPFIPVFNSAGVQTGTRAANPSDLLGACSNAFAGLGMVASDGNPVALAGKELPNSPHWTFSVGAQQSFDLDSKWQGTLRADYYKQTDSFARMYNSDYDRLKGWSNINLSLSVDNAESGWGWLLYVKNLVGDNNITDTYLTDDSSGLWSNTFMTDPRLVGLNVTKKF